MPIRAIAYASQAVAGLPQSKIDSIVEDAAHFNGVAGITGVLLFDGAWFLQYFEGPEDGVKAVHDRIQGSRSHANIVQLGQGHLPARLFPYWAMRQLAIDSLTLGRIIMADWAQFTRLAGTPGSEGTAIDRLTEVVEPYLTAA